LIVHKRLGESGTVSTKHVNRLAEIAFEIEQTCSKLSNKKRPYKILEDFDENRLSKILEDMITQKKAKTLEVEIKSQIAVVVVDTPSAQADKSCPGNPYKVGSADVAAEDICRHHRLLRHTQRSRKHFGL